MRHITPQLCAQLFCISLFFVFSSTSIAQIRPVPGTRADIGNRDWTLANLRKDLRPVSSEQQARILLTVLKDDFRQLQLVNNDLMQRTLVDARKNRDAISTKEIRSSLGEIQKRADRLKANLKLPDVQISKAEISREFELIKSLPTGLLILDRSVMKFVENPIFQRPGILDAQQSTSAAEDLHKILRMTQVLRKIAKQDSSVDQLAQKGPDN